MAFKLLIIAALAVVARAGNLGLGHAAFSTYAAAPDYARVATSALSYGAAPALSYAAPAISTVAVAPAYSYAPTIARVAAPTVSYASHGYGYSVGAPAHGFGYAAGPAVSYGAAPCFGCGRLAGHGYW